MSKERNNDIQKIESLEPMILMSASSADLNGTDGDDILVAMNPYESVSGGDGDDVITGLGGDNLLCGDAGDDLLISTSGYNALDGGEGTDTVRFLDGNRADYQVIDRGNGIIEVSDGSRIDIITNVEKFEFNDGVVELNDLLGSTNSAPHVTTGSHIQVPENQTAVVVIQATDSDGDTLTYSIADASDGALFNIDPQTGELTFKNAPDFENPLDLNGDNVYDVIIRVSDGKTTTLHTIWVGVTDVNENDCENGAPVFTNLPGDNLISVVENQVNVIDADSTDPDGDPVTYSIQGGADSSLFTIDATTGVLTFKNAPDYENPADANGDNDYLVTVRVSDGTLYTDRDLTVRVTDLNENGGNNPPYFTNVNNGQMIIIDENTTAVIDSDATDPDGDTLTYSISDGIGLPGSGNNEDAARFRIDPSTGVLTFISAPDYENPTDANGDNMYHVTIVVTDGNGGAQERQIVVKVRDVDESSNQAPYFTNVEEGENVTVPENTTLVGDADGVDPER
ncbi:MAG: cadherin domain-containing protein [Planctomycetaceae bacterium]